jgi:hypothetical protein
VASTFTCRTGIDSSVLASVDRLFRKASKMHIRNVVIVAHECEHCSSDGPVKLIESFTENEVLGERSFVV